MDLTYQNKKHSTSPSVHLISPSYYKAYVLLTIRANISMNIRYHCSVWKIPPLLRPDNLVIRSRRLDVIREISSYSSMDTALENS